MSVELELVLVEVGLFLSLLWTACTFDEAYLFTVTVSAIRILWPIELIIREQLLQLSLTLFLSLERDEDKASLVLIAYPKKKFIIKFIIF